jgi:hypothetical protein
LSDLSFLNAGYGIDEGLWEKNAPNLSGSSGESAVRRAFQPMARATSLRIAFKRLGRTVLVFGWFAFCFTLSSSVAVALIITS